MYRKIDLRQGSEAWYEWRNQGIGASDAPVIMGETKYGTRSELLAEKLTGVRSPPNEMMIRGTKLEPEARKLYIQTTGTSVRPVCLESTNTSWLRASIDGLSDDGRTVVEIKCGKGTYFQSLKIYDCPDHYFGQLQHILAVTGLSEIDFWCYLPEREPIHLCIERDDGYIDALLKAEQKFWRELQKSK
jgi:putative phage-type endonuclease